MSPDDLGALGLLGFGLMFVVFHREIAARYTSVPRRYFAWEPNVNLSAAYLWGGIFLCVAAIVLLTTR
jgi:hypothetical protein